RSASRHSLVPLCRPRARRLTRISGKEGIQRIWFALWPLRGASETPSSIWKEQVFVANTYKRTFARFSIWANQENLVPDHRPAKWSLRAITQAACSFSPFALDCLEFHAFLGDGQQFDRRRMTHVQLTSGLLDILLKRPFFVGAPFGDVLSRPPAHFRPVRI